VLRTSVVSGNGDGDELRYTLTNKTSNNVPVEGATIEISSGGHVFSTVISPPTRTAINEPFRLPAVQVTSAIAWANWAW